MYFCQGPSIMKTAVTGRLLGDVQHWVLATWTLDQAHGNPDAAVKVGNHLGNRDFFLLSLAWRIIDHSDYMLNMIADESGVFFIVNATVFQFLEQVLETRAMTLAMTPGVAPMHGGVNALARAQPPKKLFFQLQSPKIKRQRLKE
jgi:hypothetical protein